jgi:hypothetical protein
MPSRCVRRRRSGNRRGVMIRIIGALSKMNMDREGDTKGFLIGISLGGGPKY